MKKKTVMALLLTTCLLTGTSSVYTYASTDAASARTESSADADSSAKADSSADTDSSAKADSSADTDSSTKADSSTGKEEVVYIMTDAAGSVESVNVVNIFGKGAVTDYGDYSQVKMLTSTEPISLDGDKVTFTTDKDKVYYQGTLKQNKIPWNIAVSYTLDGKSISADELAGKSGALKIHLKITENTACRGDYFSSYALQASFSLDTENCKNITADGATLANVGASKQISYTVLPGKGLDAEVSADVTDFEMDAISINGVKLNLNVDVDDAELMDKVTEIMDATRSLNDGASSLSDGSARLKDASGSLGQGVDSLYEATGSLNTGIDTLHQGFVTLQQGLNTLQSKSSSLTEGSAKMVKGLAALQSQLQNVDISTESLGTLLEKSSTIKSSISGIYDGASALQQNLSYQAYKNKMLENKLDIDNLKAQNTATIATLSTQVSDMQKTIDQIKSIPDYESNTEYATQIAQLESSVAQLNGIITLLNGNNGAIGGTESYLNTISGNASSLVSNLGSLNTNYTTFDTKLSDMAQTLSGLGEKMSTLKNAVNTMNSQYQTLHSGITDYTNGVAGAAAGCNRLADGFTSLSDGSKELLDGTGTLKDGTSDLLNGIDSLTDGVNELYDGTSEFYEKTSDMDTQVEDTIDDMLSSLSGGDGETVSFASEKNTEVTSVQFVIKTAAIEKEDTSVTDEAPAEKTTFWQKFLHLFGF